VSSRNVNAKYVTGNHSLALRLAVVVIALSVPAFAFGQQGDVLSQLPGSGSFGGQANCNDLFTPCGANTDRLGGDGTSLSPFDSSDSMDSTGLNNTYPGASRPSQSIAPVPVTGPTAPPPTQGAPVESKRAPEPPTEFQLFVAAAIGKMLPLFGSQLFLTVPSTFAPLNKGPVTRDYVVGPGDELLLRAWGGINFNLRERIDRDGNIFLPHFGELRVAGLKSSELNQFLTTRISQEFRKFDLQVTLGDLRSIQVLVVGRARRPGSYTVGSLSTLVDVLFASGGPSSSGSMRDIELRRDGKVITTVDLYKILTEGDNSTDLHLLPGDVIYIPSAGPRIAVAGSVSQPAIYELRDSDTVAAALKLAGGTTSIAALQRAELERVDAKGVRHIIELTLDQQGTQSPVMNGDVLRVFQIVPRFDNAVILRGNVANPGRYAWRPGMRITDLIPNKEILVTRAALSNHNALALTDNERANAQRIHMSSLASNGMHSNPTTGNASGSEAAGTMPSQNNTEAGAANASPTSSLPDDLSTGRESKPQEDPDATAQVSGSSTGRSIASDTGGPSDEFARKNEVTLVAPEINWDYAVVERTNPDDLTTSLKPFPLGRVILGHDETDNFELQPGDVLTIFSQADIRVPRKRQNKLVRLEGEFGAAGVYSVRPGETLRDLVIRAGGLTDDAYLFGSSFTRRSTRLQQQARLDEYTFDLESEIEREAGDKAGSVVNPQEAIVAASSLQSQQALVAQLRQMRASGRIVLNILPTSDSADSIPAIPLEDGDVFLVPAHPSSVSVVGAVYDQNAFLFENSTAVGHYLQLSGGISKSGDWKHAFVIRADGSVISHNSTLARSSHGLENFGLNPGDAIVVPEVLNKTTFLRGLNDWSAILSQFGLGVAAINVLR
jgi:polysaccharide biosynthesis/export protein